MNTSGTVSTRPLPWKSWMVKRPMLIGRDASKRLSSVTLPESSAIAVVKLLKVEPISKMPADMRFSRSLSCAL